MCTRWAASYDEDRCSRRFVQRDKEMKPTRIFIGNSFQTPNLFVDKVMAYLTGDELKVLIFALRRTLGWHKYEDHISISQFSRRAKKKDGSNYLFGGTGLCIGTVRKCLSNLEGFGLMRRISKNTRELNNGDLWAVNFENEEAINWAALEERLQQKSRNNADRLVKARAMRHTPKLA